MKLKAIRQLERQAECGGCLEDEDEFDPIDLNDIDEFSDVFYNSTPSESSEDEIMVNGETKFTGAKLQRKSMSTARPSLFNPTLRAKIFAKKRIQMTQNMFKSVQVDRMGSKKID